MNIFLCINIQEINQEPDGINVVLLSPSERSCFTGTFREAEMCTGFLPPQAALVIVASWGEMGSLGSMVQQ